MANPQDNKMRKTPSAPGSGTSATGPESAGANPTSSAGRDQDRTNPGATTMPRQTAATNTETAGATGARSDNVQPISTRASAADRPMTEKISDTASGILDKAKETASGTYDAVATQATNKIEERKGELSTGLRTLADTFRKTGDDLKGASQTTPLTNVTARYTGTAASQIEKVANYFERKDLRAMMRDAEGFARRNPAIFLGAAFALGMVAARFLKSSTPDQTSSVNTGSLNTPLPTALPSAGSTGTGAPRDV